MADPVALTHAFMRLHPAEAAHVLESVPPDVAAALFEEVPVRLGAGVLGAMTAGAAAQSVAALDEGRAMELLAQLGIQPAAALLRHLGDDLRERLIAGLPTAAALASRLLLAYPEDAVGAWTDTAIVALPPDTRAGDALERVRRIEQEVAEVFVAGAGQRLLGRVPLAVLLRAPPDVPLDLLAVPTAGVLAAQTPLAGALAHPAWEQVAELPVMASGDRLIGVLTRAALSRALLRLQGPVAGLPEETLTGLAARSYWSALSGIIAALLGLLPRTWPMEAPRVTRGDERQ